MLGEVAQIGFGLLASANVADGDGVTRLVGKGHRPRHELDADHSAVGVAQAGIDHFAGAAKQLCPHRFVGDEGRQKGTRNLFLGSADQHCKATVGGVDPLTVADQQTFDGGIGEAAHAVGLQLKPTAVANVEGQATTGKQ